MLLRILLVFCFASAASIGCRGQNTAPQDSLSIPKLAPQSVEEVDGLLAFAGYIGKKIYDGVSEEFSDNDQTKKNQTKRVRIKLGPIKIERIEKR